MHKAYATLEIKAIDEDRRTIEGIATTNVSDRMNDIVDPEGAEFKLPLPLLWQHDSEKPIPFNFNYCLLLSIFISTYRLS